EGNAALDTGASDAAGRAVELPGGHVSLSGVGSRNGDRLLAGGAFGRAAGGFGVYRQLERHGRTGEGGHGRSPKAAELIRLDYVRQSRYQQEAPRRFESHAVCPPRDQSERSPRGP